MQQVIGIHAVRTLLQKRAARVEQVCILAKRRDRRLNEIVSLASSKNIEVRTFEKRELDELTARADGNGAEATEGEGAQNEGVFKHQGVVAVLKQDRISNEDDLDDILDKLDAPPFLLILDGVTDPHNLGACLRSANAAGVHAVIVPKDKSAPLNAAARKVACGAAECTPLIRVTNLARSMRSLQERGVWLIGAAGEASEPLHRAELKGALAIVMGAEDKGMRRLTREHCDSLVYIPMSGDVSSLNVSVATGVCLFEAVRQRIPSLEVAT